MSQIKFKILPRGEKPLVTNEKLHVSAHSLKGNLNCFTGKQGEFWVSIIPSLNVSGYGQSEEEALNDLGSNFEVLCKDLFSINDIQRNAELNKLGWEINKFFKKRFSKSFVDENGTLQNFDYPEKVKKSILEAA